METVAAFTDTYLPTVNGVSYTVRTWRETWRDRGGRMPVVYPRDADYAADVGEYGVPSVPFPFYPGFRFGWPQVPPPVVDADPAVVHAHTPFSMGLAGRRLAAERGVPLVASFHTPAREYAAYISDAFAGTVRGAADRYERWFLEEADALVVPTETAARQVRTAATDVHVVSNGVDTDLFGPVDDSAVAAFRRRHDLPEGPLVGYTGRLGHEKRVGDLLSATVGVDCGVVVGGDGPARAALERRGAAREDVVFLGFLDREELPTFYSALEAFAFPSPIETQGLVALEAVACGTPVVAVDGGALSETVTDGETGYHYRPGDLDGFRRAIRRTIRESASLSERCLERRDELCVERSIDDLLGVYETLT